MKSLQRNTTLARFGPSPYLSVSEPPREAFSSAFLFEECRRARRERDRRNGAQPIKDPGRAALILSGAESAAPMFAVGLLADTQGMSYNAITAKLKDLMRVALYLADCKVAELRAAEGPRDVEALAVAAVKHYGVEFLETLSHHDPEDREVFPKQGRMLAAVDAAFRWQWKALLPPK